MFWFKLIIGVFAVLMGMAYQHRGRRLWNIYDYIWGTGVYVSGIVFLLTSGR